MKKLLNNYPNVSSYLLSICLFGLCLVISGLINKGALKEYFPYTSLILLFIATGLIYRSENKSLTAIGLNFNLKNISLLPLGVLIGGVTFLGSKFIRAFYLGESIAISDSVNCSVIFLSFYYILPQVATEELLFRGYLFKKTISITGVVIANVIFSVLFMLIHVIDGNVLSNKGMVILLVVTIPVGHLLFATALLKSKTLFFPIGIHLGNNWATRHLISSNSSGDSLLSITNATTFETWTPFLVMLILTNGFYLLITFLIWKWDKLSQLLKNKGRFF